MRRRRLVPAVTPVTLPAVRGDQAVSWMAGLGVIRLLSDLRNIPARLSWDEETGAAIVHSRLDSLEAVAAELAEVVASIPDGGVLPEVTDPSWPPPKPPRRRDLRAFAQHAGLVGAAHWVPALFVEPLLTSQDRQKFDEWAKEPARYSPYIALFGAQTLRTALGKSAKMLREQPHLMVDDLRRGIRTAGCSGEQLDASAYITAADSPTGKSDLRGRPAMTWLALMALPLLPATNDNFGPIAPGWQRLNPAWDRTGPLRMVWPLWEPPLDVCAVQVLVTHPAMAVNPSPPAINGKARWAVEMGWLRMLGVFRVCAAARMPLGGNAYLLPLTPVPPPDAAVKLTAEEAAARAGVEWSTWRSYVNRGYAPQRDGVDGGRPWWWSSTIDGWKRRGQGTGGGRKTQNPDGSSSGK